MKEKSESESKNSLTDLSDPKLQVLSLGREGTQPAHVGISHLRSGLVQLTLSKLQLLAEDTATSVLAVGGVIVQHLKLIIFLDRRLDMRGLNN